VDGLLYFYESKDDRAKIIVQVKGGGVKRDDMATLLGDVNNQKALRRERLLAQRLVLQFPQPPLMQLVQYRSTWHDGQQTPMGSALRPR